MAKLPRAPDAPKTGRPTAYNDERGAEMVAFFRARSDEGKFPMFSSYAIHIGVCRDTVDEWRNRHPAFSDAYKMCKEIQEAALVDGALTGRFQPAFSIFTAKNVIGWRDKSEHEHSGNVKHEHVVLDPKDMTPEQRDAARAMMLAAKKKGDGTE